MLNVLNVLIHAEQNASRQKYRQWNYYESNFNNPTYE